MKMYCKLSRYIIVNVYGNAEDIYKHVCIYPPTKLNTPVIHTKCGVYFKYEVYTVVMLEVIRRIKNKTVNSLKIALILGYETRQI